MKANETGFRPGAVDAAVSVIKSISCPSCFLCGSYGEPLYEGLEDKLFGVPGVWNLKRCPDRRCGVAWLDPMPLPEEIPKAYAGNYVTHQEVEAPKNNLFFTMYRWVRTGYLKSRYGYYQSAPGTLGRLAGFLMYLFPPLRSYVNAQVFYLPAKNRGRLLDVGCGSGRVMRWMSSLGWVAEGLDPDPVALKVAREKGLQVQQGMLSEQQFAAESFDAVIMSHVIEHVHDPFLLMKECHRILRPGGRLIVITPNLASWGHRIFRRHWRGLEPPRHLNILSLASLLCICSRVGFRGYQGRSIARSAREILGASQSLRRVAEGARPTGGALLSRLQVRLISVGEWAACYLDREAGEELVLIATK